jgi:c(7)-type cytochrome triheme protein
MMKKIFWVLTITVLCAGLAVAQTGVKKKRALPHEYGNLVIGNYSERAGLPAVEFNHWLHRSLYTCRLCHVDLAVAMKAGGTNIKAVDNARGYYCGACHDGNMKYNNKAIFQACQLKYTQEEVGRCERCHSAGRVVKRDYDFYELTSKFPKERFGNGIDWMKAEEEGLIKPINFIEGISVPRKSMKTQDDFSLTPKVAGMPEIVFSHKKHTVWNGCELCHPEIFLGVKKGSTKYSMLEIYDGKYCGVCHIKVAFPLIDCQRCHTKPV